MSKCSECGIELVWYEGFRGIAESADSRPATLSIVEKLSQMPRACTQCQKNFCTGCALKAGEKSGRGHSTLICPHCGADLGKVEDEPTFINDFGTANPIVSAVRAALRGLTQPLVLLYRPVVSAGDYIDRYASGRVSSFLILLPSVLLLAVFVYGFIGWTAHESTTNSNALQQLSGMPTQDVGLQNYENLFTGTLNSRFRIDVVNTIFFTVMFIAACLTIGLVLAILLDQRIRGEGIFRTIFLFPMALSFVVTGVVWKWLFNPTSGINALPKSVGLPAGKFRWFISEDRWLEFQWGNIIQIMLVVIIGVIFIVALWYWVRNRSMVAAMIAGLAMIVNVWITLAGAKQLMIQPENEMQGFNVALIAVVVASAWQMSGYTMAMYLAGLRGIPEELREAARVDGATEIAVYRHVIWPILKPITLSAMIILGHISLKIFDLVYTLGGGGNLYIDMPGINMFLTTFRSNDFGKGAAIAMIMLILVAFVIIPYLWSSMRSETQL